MTTGCCILPLSPHPRPGIHAAEVGGPQPHPPLPLQRGALPSCARVLQQDPRPPLVPERPAQGEAGCGHHPSHIRADPHTEGPWQSGRLCRYGTGEEEFEFLMGRGYLRSRVFVKKLW